MKPSFKVISQIFLVLVFGILGCQTNAPDSPLTDLTVKRTPNQLQFLQAQKLGFHKVFKTEQYVTASGGGTVLLGDEEYGYCSLEFMPGDLNDNTIIIFEWDTDNFTAELTPHGINFNNPVKLTLSYKDADLSTVEEQALRVWYYEEPENDWELVGGQVNEEEQQVEAYISHFSRYALAGED
jgi:hypothetical protein